MISGIAANIYKRCSKRNSHWVRGTCIYVYVRGGHMEYLMLACIWRVYLMLACIWRTYLMLACIWRAYGVPHVSLYTEDIPHVSLYMEGIPHVQDCSLHLLCQLRTPEMYHTSGEWQNQPSATSDREKFHLHMHRDVPMCWGRGLFKPLPCMCWGQKYSCLQNKPYMYNCTVLRHKHTKLLVLCLLNTTQSTS